MSLGRKSSPPEGGRSGFSSSQLSSSPFPSGAAGEALVRGPCALADSALPVRHSFHFPSCRCQSGRSLRSSGCSLPCKELPMPSTRPWEHIHDLFWREASPVPQLPSMFRDYDVPVRSPLVGGTRECGHWWLSLAHGSSLGGDSLGSSEAVRMRLSGDGCRHSQLCSLALSAI